MCIHPEGMRDRHIHTCAHHATMRDVYLSNQHRLPSKAQWMIRQTNFESTEKEKFEQYQPVQRL